MRIFLLVCVFMSFMDVISVEQGSYEEVSKGLQWMETPQEGLPNVLILGDSISIGYTLFVREMLKGKANVYRPINKKGAENCGSTHTGLQRLDAWQ